MLVCNFASSGNLAPLANASTSEGCLATFLRLSNDKVGILIVRPYAVLDFFQGLNPPQPVFLSFIIPREIAWG